jgi:aldehyde:ferredoxin oxidoreductase
MAGLCKLPWIDVRHPRAGEEREPAKNLPSLRLILDYYNASLGTKKTLDDLLFESECVYTFHKLFNLRQGRGTRENDRIPARAMGPVFENEYESRGAHYDEYLSEAVGVDPTGLETSEKIRRIQQYRQAQYERMTDVVYDEKGYDRNGVPTLATLQRFGFDTPDIIAIVGKHAQVESPA